MGSLLNYISRFEWVTSACRQADRPRQRVRNKGKVGATSNAGNYRAQWEIRELAYKMLEQAKEAAPLLFKNAGASCVATGHCPEGAMTCGKFAEMIKMRTE